MTQELLEGPPGAQSDEVAFHPDELEEEGSVGGGEELKFGCESVTGGVVVWLVDVVP
jgi:hypothetical protein